MTFRLRLPRADEQEALAMLCRRSKGHWGYSAEFLDECADTLRVNPILAEQGLVRVAEHEGACLGIVQVDPDASSYGSPFQQDAELDLLFVDPLAMGRGIGRALFDFAHETTARLGFAGLASLSDPGARGFYESQGAVFVRDAPSDVVTGRTLPLLRSIH